MTSAEMKTNFLIEFDYFASGQAAGLLDSEINYILNRAQENYVKFGYNPNANAGKEGYEETEKRAKDFSELDNFTTISTFSTGNHPNSFFASLPDKLWFATKEEAEITFTDDCGNSITQRVEVRPISKNYYNRNIDNPDKCPYEELVWRLDFSRANTNQPLSVTNPKRHELITFTGATINNYYLHYLKYPKAIDVTVTTGAGDCELDPATHNKIIGLSVELAAEILKPQRFQSKKIQESIVE